MKPLLSTVVALCLILPTLAHPENIEEVKELPQSKEPVVEAEESKSQARKERCSKCSSTVGLDLKSPKDLIAALQTLPGGEVHTQQSFEGCSSSKGCAGIKVQDGKVTDKFGNLNAFGGENTFKAGSTFGSNLLNGKISGEPLWWMGANSPFKNINSASYKASSSYTSTTGGAIGAGGADLSKNIFLNPGASGFAGGQSNYDASSSSFQATKEGELDVANNPFLNGNINLAQSGLAGGKGFAAQGGSAFGAGSTTAFGSGSGYVGSSPSPFATSTGPNINLIQSAQKPSVFDIDQTQQTINDDIFAGGSNVNLQVPSGEGLQQSCLGQGYACVLRPQCSNGVTSAIPLTKKQYCDTRTEVCCRLDASLSGIPQTPLGVGFATSDTEIQGSGLLNTQSTTNQGFGVQTAFNGASSYDANQATVGNNFGSTVPVVTAIPIGSTGAFGPTNTPTGFTGSTLRPVSGQGNVLNTDTFTSQSENTNVFRPGAVGTGLKPGIPYLPPVDNTNSGTNVVSSTVFPSTPLFTTPRPVSTPRPILPRPVTTPRPYTPVRPVTTPRPVSRPTYLPPVSSTSAPGYLPPVGEQTINRETFVPSPDYNEGGIILDESRFPSTTRQPIVPVLNEIPAGCAAALKCTPIEFCTADGIISNTTIILSRDQNAYRVPLTDCKDLATGRIGKCCRDPFYTDPWPTNQLGKWVPGVFGGNDGKYVPDNRDSSSTIRNQVTGRPDVTGSTLLNIFRNPKTTPPTFGTTPGQGEIGIVGQGLGIEQGQGSIISQGKGQRNKFGLVSQGIQLETGQGQYTEQGVGKTVVQGGGVGILQGGGVGIQQGGGLITENEYGASTNRIYLQRYDGAGQCGVKHGQRPYGNHDNLEVDFAEIPWQAMVLLQSNKSLLCGGVISRPDVVLTSASCVDGLDARNVLVKGGEWKLGIDDEPLPFQIVQVKTIIFHPGYRSGSLQDDVAILYLSENLRLANNIQPICMPDSSDSINAFYNGGGQCIVTGWGKIVLQAHLEGSIMHSVNVSLIQPNECESRLQQNYPHLLDNYDRDSCACGQPTNPLNNICKVDIGSALACTTGDGYYVMQGIYSWDSGCQVGNQLAAFYKFDIEWYEWAIGLTESVRYSQYGVGTKVTQTKYTGQVTSGTKGIQYNNGFKGTITNGVKGIGQGTQIGVSQGVTGQGEIGIVGQGLGIEQGQGTIISQGKGQRNKYGLVSQGTIVENGQGQYTEQGVGKTVVQGGGVGIVQGGGVGIQQGGGVGILQGGGVGIQQGGGLIAENEYGASTNRIYLQRYDGAGQCGVKHGQRPYGNHDNLEVDFAEIPWQAMVLLQSNKSLLCGGVISRPDVVLTSASCVDGLDARNVLVKGGEWKLGIDDEPLPFQIVQVKTIIFHPGYRSGSLQDDVAILYLSENLRLANNIQPICMPDSSDSINAFYNGGGQCIVTGWGKIVLQAHLAGSIMHSVNVSLIQPDECESRLQQNYPHLLDNYDRDSCACGQPTNPLNNICKVDIGSALACTTGDGYYVMQGIYSWDSGCQVGNQLAAFYKFDIEWYEWAIGLTESVRYSQYGIGTKVTQTKYTGQVTSGTKGIQYNNGFKGTITNGVKGIGQGTQIGVSQGTGQTQFSTSQTKYGTDQTQFGIAKTQFDIGQIGVNHKEVSAEEFAKLFGQGQLTTNFSNFGKFDQGSTGFNSGGLNLGTEIKGPISNTFSATYSEKKYYQSEPKIITYTTKPEIVTYTTKPEIVTFTTKPEIFTYTTKPKIVTYTTKPKIITYTTKPKIITYTTKPKIVTYTTKPQFITYETSGSGTNPQYIAPGVTFNPSFSQVVGAQHKHNAECKCLENGKK
ncbi:PREDICTED: uncharacterized protein LOC106124294 isoform X3 [Papilio xuthus]|uniref:Uncharacterized protein LOC106124294 isoform X3 n=1 Tax=Papilio xuthus TaxID=66420 RepID=A0AAJ7EG80_PAPXU|nr:PREDICTED: uncharacterized protein LOC106124294 isoform X3 [Papilio xuthus]